MDPPEMDGVEPKEDCFLNLKDGVFKTPQSKFPSRKSEDYNLQWAHHSPDCVKFLPSNLNWPSQDSVQNDYSSKFLSTPDSGFSDLNALSTPECSSLDAHSLGVESSFDSGFRSLSGSAVDSADSNLEEDALQLSTSHFATLPNSLITLEDGTCQPTGRISLACASSASEANRNFWQSTPDVVGVKPASFSFETPQEDTGFGKSPIKHRRASLRRSPRGLFQSSRKKGPNAFPRPFLGNYSTSGTLLKSSLVGKEHLDFVSYLGKHSVLQPALDAILGYLDPSDLCRACLVSRSWKNVVESVPIAKKRKTEYVKLRTQAKENLHKLAKKSESEEVLPHRGQLMAIQNFSRTVEPRSEPRSPPVSPSKVRFHLFLKEGRKLENGQTLLQCPKCNLPSLKESESAARCTRQGCQHHFCILCRCEFHGGKACPVSVKHRKRQTAIGSRQSRRNLQRLCK